jgi:hypothetical protein
MIESLPTGRQRTSLLERALAELGTRGENFLATQAELLRRGLPQLSLDAQRSVARELSGTGAALTKPADVNT